MIEVDKQLRIDPKEFTLGEEYPNPVIFPNGAMVLINEHLTMALISANGELEEIIKPVVPGYYTTDLEVPIFRPHDLDGYEIASFFPGQSSVYILDLRETQKTSFKPLISHIEYKAEEYLRPSDNATFDFYYSPALETYYFLKFFADEQVGRLYNYIFSVSRKNIKPEGQNTVVMRVEGIESPTRCIVHQSEDLILFGLALENSILVRIEQAGKPVRRLRFQNFSILESPGCLPIERLFCGVGSMIIDGRTIIFLLSNNSLLTSDIIYIDVTNLIHASTQYDITPTDTHLKSFRLYMIDYADIGVDYTQAVSGHEDEGRLNLIVSGQLLYNPYTLTLQLFDCNMARYSYGVAYDARTQELLLKYNICYQPGPIDEAVIFDELCMNLAGIRTVDTA